MEPREIVSILREIAESELSVDEYLREYAVPFSRPQYFRYKARFAAESLDGLLDGRGRGNTAQGWTMPESTKVEISFNKIQRLQGLDDLARILFPNNKEHQKVFLAMFLELKYASDVIVQPYSTGLTELT